MPAFTAREIETQTLLEHVRKQRSVLVLGRGGIGKSALLEIHEPRPFSFQSPILRYSNCMSVPAKGKPGKKQSTVAYLLATVERIAKEAPASELEKLPKDGAANLDHYLYGAPKR
jgi:hypothetical protein